MSAIPTSVNVAAGDTFVEVVAPVAADSVVVIQQYISDTDFEFTFAGSAPAATAPAFTVRPEMAREWISWNVSSGHGVYVRHKGADGNRTFTVSVEDA